MESFHSLDEQERFEQEREERERKVFEELRQKFEPAARVVERRKGGS